MRENPVTRRLSLGSTLTGPETNRLLDHLDRRAAAPVGFDPTFNDGSPQSLDIRTNGFWARIDGRSGNRYAYTRVWSDAGGGLVQPDAGFFVASGTTDLWFAVELAGSAAVNIGSVQWLEPSNLGPWMEFVDNGSGTASGSGQGGGDLTTVCFDYLYDVTATATAVCNPDNSVTVTISLTKYRRRSCITGPDLTITTAGL